MAESVDESSCAFCLIKVVQRHRYLINGSNDYLSYMEDLPFDVILPENAEYLCQTCARLMQQRKRKKEKLEELEDILLKRHNGDLTANRMNKEPKAKRQYELPSFDEEPPNKVAIVSAGSIKRVYEIVRQPPVVPKKHKYLLPKVDMQLEGANKPIYPAPVLVPRIGNTIHYADGTQKSLVATRHIEIVKIPTSSRPILPNNNLVNSTDTKDAKHVDTSAQKGPKNQNIEKLNIAETTSSSTLPLGNSVITLSKEEKINSCNKVTQQSLELQDKEQVKLIPIMTTGKVLNKPISVNDEKKIRNEIMKVVEKSPVITNNQQIKNKPMDASRKSSDKQALNGNEKTDAQQKILVLPMAKQQKKLAPTSAIEATTNKPNVSKGNTTYTFNLEDVKGCLKLSEQNSNKIINLLKNPTNLGLAKSLNIQSASTNVAIQQAPSLCPDTQQVEKLNAPLSISPTKGPGKLALDDNGNVLPIANRNSSPIAGHDETLRGEPTSVKLIIHWTRNSKTVDLAPDLFSIAVMLSKGTHKQIALSVWKHPKIQSSLINLLPRKIEREGCALCGLGGKKYFKGESEMVIYIFT